MRLSILFSMLVVLASTAFAASCMNPDTLIKYMAIDTDLGGVTMGTALGLVFMFTIVLIALAFMLSKVTNNPALTVFYKDELFHLIMSAVFLATIGGILTTSCAVTSGFLDFALVTNGGSTCYSGTETAQEVALCHVKELEKDATNTLKAAIKQSVAYDMDSTFTYTLYNPFTGGITVPFGAYKKTYAMQMDMIAMSYLMPVSISIAMQKLLVGFSVDIVSYLLPIAFIFRVLPSTRQMGNILIAAAIAMYVIIPTMYALNAAMDETAFSASCSSNKVNLGGGTKLPINDAVMGGCSEPYNFWNIARLIPQAFFLPNLTLALVITCLASINKALKVIG